MGPAFSTRSTPSTAATWFLRHVPKLPIHVGQVPTLLVRSVLCTSSMRAAKPRSLGRRRGKMERLQLTSQLSSSPIRSGRHVPARRSNACLQCRQCCKQPAPSPNQHVEYDFVRDTGRETSRKDSPSARFRHTALVLAHLTVSGVCRASGHLGLGTVGGLVLCIS